MLLQTIYLLYLAYLYLLYLEYKCLTMKLFQVKPVNLENPFLVQWRPQFLSGVLRTINNIAVSARLGISPN